MSASANHTSTLFRTHPQPGAGQFLSSPEHWLARWQLSYAPLTHAYRLVYPDWRGQMSDDLSRLANRFTEIDADGRFIRCDYLEFLVRKSETQ